MGDIADLMLEGEICQVCGVELDDGNAGGFPRTCAGCQGFSGDEEHEESSSFDCGVGHCKKHFNSLASARQHRRDKHGV